MACSLVAAGGVLASAGPAGAAYPGTNGLIAFVSVISGTAQIQTIDPSNGARRTLTPGVEPSWNPYGTRILYSAGGDVWVMSPTGGSKKDLTNNASYTEDAPTWSPDGRHIAYTVSGAQNAGDIYVANADGTNPVQLTTDVHADSSPAWSVNGQIAFVSNRSGHANIWVMNADGTNQHDLTGDAYAEADPAWSPDGSRIVFNGPLHPAARAGQGVPPGAVSGGDLWTVNADGSGLTPLNHGGGAYSDGNDPEWSPDGSTIVFSGNEGVGVLNLWSCPAAGGSQQQVTHEGTQLYDQGANWQPVRRARVVISPKSGAPGSTVTVTGRGFAANEKVKLTFTQSRPSTTLATVTTTSNGGFSTTVTVPASAVSGTATIAGTGNVSYLKSHMTFTVT